MLRIRNLTSGYGRIRALHNVSIHVWEGEIVSIIGANGSGKTTLINTISGIVIPTSGTIMSIFLFGTQQWDCNRYHHTSKTC